MNESNVKTQWKPGEVYVVVGRHINGISLNDYEYLLDEDGYMRQFASEIQAVEYLHSQGVTDDEIEYQQLFYWCECPKCHLVAFVKNYEALEDGTNKIIKCERCEHETKFNLNETEETKNE